MMKYLTLFLLIFIFFACDQKSKIEKEVEAIPIDVKVDRFDKAFFTAAPEQLSDLKMRYPFFFPQQTPDEVWIDKLQNPLWQDLYSEVDKKFGNFEVQHEEIEDLVKHIKYFYPETPTPKVITVVSEMDYHNKAIYADSLILISLELYLGKDHKFYANEFPEYIRYNFEPRQMMPDIVSSFAQRKVSPAGDNSLMSQMIYHGKTLYLKQMLLPEHTDAEKIGYTPDQITWCEENENYMWRYFVDGELLYNSDQKLIMRFISPAPFSKFYLEIDNETPGRVGQWLGWQIVRSYMANNKVSLQQMLGMDARQIFEKSRYKPKKNE